MFIEEEFDVALLVPLLVLLVDLLGELRADVCFLELDEVSESH